MPLRAKQSLRRCFMSRALPTRENTGYFVYCNGQDAEAFDGRIEFFVKLLPYTGSDYWIEGALVGVKDCLMADEIPSQHPDCEFCGYAHTRAAMEIK